MLSNFIFASECEPGYYSTNCSLACSPNCKTCRHMDGLCSCKAGWKGHNCTTGDTFFSIFHYLWRDFILATGNRKWTIIEENYFSECFQSYGENCQYPCSEHCIDHKCDRFNGKCLCNGKHGKPMTLSNVIFRLKPKFTGVCCKYDNFKIIIHMVIRYPYRHR